MDAETEELHWGWCDQAVTRKYWFNAERDTWGWFDGCDDVSTDAGESEADADEADAMSLADVEADFDSASLSDDEEWTPVEDSD